MSAFDPYGPGETKFRREFLIGAAALVVPLGTFLVLHPELDLALSTTFWEMCPPPKAGRPWCTTETVTMARQLFIALFALLALATLAVTTRVLIARRRWLGLDQARCLFMIAVLIVGPGVVANLAFKENLGRARPRDVVDFGGTKAFTPALVPSRECARNCSFISGEASSLYAAFFALALLIPQYRLALLIGGIAAGSLAGLVRMIQGAHFLSDVLFAGIFMAMTVSLLHIAIIGFWRDPQRIWNTINTLLLPLTRAGISFARGRG
jgi:lipid A 4'-phosphatase